MNDDMKKIQDLAEIKGYEVVKYDEFLYHNADDTVEPRWAFIFKRKNPDDKLKENGKQDEIKEIQK